MSWQWEEGKMGNTTKTEIRRQMAFQALWVERGQGKEVKDNVQDTG